LSRAAVRCARTASGGTGGQCVRMGVRGASVRRVVGEAHRRMLLRVRVRVCAESCFGLYGGSWTSQLVVLFDDGTLRCWQRIEHYEQVRARARPTTVVRSRVVLASTPRCARGVCQYFAWRATRIRSPQARRKRCAAIRGRAHDRALRLGHNAHRVPQGPHAGTHIQLLPSAPAERSRALSLTRTAPHPACNDNPRLRVTR
jgi:hypothetical protein